MASSLDLIKLPTDTGEFVGKPLDKVINLLGEYSKMEQKDSNDYYVYTWNLQHKIIKLAFDGSKKCSKIISDENVVNMNWRSVLIKSPIFLTLFAGLVSIVVGYTWEYFKFKRQTVFEKRIDLILDSRKQVQDIFIEYDRLIRQIRSYETEYNRLNLCDPSNLSSQVEELKLLGLRVRYIQEFSKGVINNPELMNNISLFEKENVNYINCITENINCNICSEAKSLPLNYLNKIIELHTTEINNQIK